MCSPHLSQKVHVLLGPLYQSASVVWQVCFNYTVSTQNTQAYWTWISSVNLTQLKLLPKQNMCATNVHKWIKLIQHVPFFSVGWGCQCMHWTIITATRVCTSNWPLMEKVIQHEHLVWWVGWESTGWSGSLWLCLSWCSCKRIADTNSKKQSQWT